MNEALSQLVEFSIREQNLNHITALILSQNAAAIKRPRKLNFAMGETYPTALKKDNLNNDIQIWQLLKECTA